MRLVLFIALVVAAAAWEEYDIDDPDFKFYHFTSEDWAEHYLMHDEGMVSYPPLKFHGKPSEYEPTNWVNDTCNGPIRD